MAAANREADPDHNDLTENVRSAQTLVGAKPRYMVLAVSTRRRTIMMQGPWYLFHPDSPGYLERKLENGDHISRADLVRVFEANPGHGWAGDLHALYSLILNGTFRGKPGPKERFSWAMWQCINAWVDLEAEDIREDRAGRPHERSDLSPMQQACENTARRFKLGTGASLANSLTSRNLR